MKVIKAFPMEYFDSHQSGMDLRDYFAGQAIDGFLADGGWGGDLSYFEDVAEGAYKLADAMMKARAA
jgi:hypothetical protein